VSGSKDGIEPTGAWTFGGDTPAGFDDHVERSIPWYAAGHELVVDVADHVVCAGGRCYELGCSTGTLTALLAARLEPRGADVVGVDGEPAMIAVARERFAGRPGIGFEVVRLEAFEPGPADLVVSYYTLQFVHVRDRRPLLERIRRALEPAGVLLLFEKVLLPPARVQDFTAAIYHDWKRRQGFSDAEVAAKERSLRGVLRPQTPEENLAMLADAGFGDAVAIFRWLNWEGLLVRPSRSPPGSAPAR
jgi:tRNA (cmo5U34)-methyltransferase